jgi:hypothetical protein
MGAAGGTNERVDPGAIGGNGSDGMPPPGAPGTAAGPAAGGPGDPRGGTVPSSRFPVTGTNP